MCDHGYVALTCPRCRSASPARIAPVPTTVVDSRPHYSGAPAETRRQLSQAWPDIIERTVGRIEQSAIREGISNGALQRRQAEVA